MREEHFMKSLKIAIIVAGGILSLYGLYMIFMTIRTPHPAFSDVETSPFSFIVVCDGSIIATLPDFSYWMVREGSAEPRKTKSSESFIMHAGSSLSIFEKHSSYIVTAQLTPKQGIMIEAEDDKRSFGGELTKKLYFIPAKKIEQVSDSNPH